MLISFGGKILFESNEENKNGKSAEGRVCFRDKKATNTMVSIEMNSANVEAINNFLNFTDIVILE
jgi:hypothetical protein